MFFYKTKTEQLKFHSYRFVLRIHSIQFLTNQNIGKLIIFLQNQAKSNRYQHYILPRGVNRTKTMNISILYHVYNIFYLCLLNI